MIMTKKEDGTYKQVGFIYRNDEIDISGEVPVNFKTMEGVIGDYMIEGNTYQSDGASPDTPQEVHAVGDKTGNLFDIDNITRETLSADGSTSFSSAMNLSGLIAVNGDFTVSWDAIINGAYMRISTYDENKNFIERIGTINTYNDRSYTNAHVGYIRINYENHYQLSQVQVNLGSEALPYEPYGYKIPITTRSEDGTESITTPIYLDKPLYKIGDYADSIIYAEQKVERVIKELVLTGGESFIADGENTNTIRFYTIEIINYLSGISYCTHFINQKQNVITGGDTEGFALYNGKQVGFRVSKNIGTTTTAFKAWLKEQYNNGTPVKVYYILAEPEIKSIDLPKIPTFDGTNIIDINTEIKPSNISLSRPMTEIKKILNKEGKILFEKGFTREVESVLPLTLNGIDKPLKNYTIYGNTLQNGTPTPDNPVEVQAVGDYDTATGKYKILITTKSEDGVESITTPIYLDSPLYKNGNYADAYGMTEEVRAIKELILTGDENWNVQSINQHGLTNLYINVSPLFAVGSTALCSHFTAQKTLIAQTTDEGIYLSNNNLLYIRIRQEIVSTTTAFKTWLKEQYNNGTPVTVYYILAEPETESVTLPKIPTLDGTTVIDVKTEIEPSNMYVKYKSSK